MSIAKCVHSSFQILVLCDTLENKAATGKKDGRPWGSSVISSGAICPSRSRVAWTLEVRPFANLLADWPRFKFPKLVWIFAQLSIVAGFVAEEAADVSLWRCSQTD